MPAVIVLILTWFTRYLILKVIAIVGVAVGSYAIIQTFFDKYVNAGLAQLGGMPSDLMGLVGIAHIDHAISIVLGAMSVRAFITAARTMLAKL
ncbi:DUF2523 family protein [Psychrobacter aestuarii]|uniref:DUF2523 domain-containing protein n=1 Tax=Psychrobacter aestuarii TaxID=556327 RepID=A0ABP3FU44_9GAMM|nr:DUF2523 family protein [Psychrobacter aestuarii]